MKERNVRAISLKLVYVLDFLLRLIERINRKKYNTLIFEAVTRIFSDKVYESRQYYDVIEKRITSQVILSLPSFGCSHYFKHGGCGMCAFNQEIERYNLRFLHPVVLVWLVKLFLVGLDRYIFIKAVRAETLTVFMAGSFLNGEELPIAAQNEVNDFFIRSKFAKLVVESRPEYVVREKNRLKKYIARAANNLKKIEIATGLESSDNHIRNKLIGKRMTKDIYTRSIAIINGLGAISNTYILIGAPYLTRQEIVTKAVASAKYAWEQKSMVVSLEAYFVQAGTRWAEIYKQGKLRVPKLWDIIDVIKTINKYSPSWYLGEFSDWPKPIVSPQNCPLCTDRVLKAFNFLRINHSISVLKNLNCYCRDNNNAINLEGGANYEY